MIKKKQAIEELLEEALVPKEEQRFQIPVNWVWTWTGTVAEVMGGGTPKSTVKEYYEDGTIPWITPADLSRHQYMYISKGNRYITELGLNKSSARMLPVDTVLLSSRAPIGYVAIAAKALCTNQGFKSFVPSNALNPKYLYWYLKFSKFYLESMASGSTFKELSGAKCKDIQLPLPPINEQKRIAEKVEHLLNKIEEAKRLIEEAKETFELRRAAIFDKAFRGELTKKWRSKNPNISFQLIEIEEERKKLKEKYLRSKSYKKPVKISLGDKTKGITKIYEIPYTWQWVTIDQVTWSVSDGPHFSPKYVEKDEGIPFISTRNINYKGISFEDCKFVSHEDHKEFSKRANPEIGDVILTKGGTTGIATVVEENQPFSIWVHLALLKVIKNYVSPHYLRDVLSSPFVYIQSQAQTRGVTNKDLGLTRLIYMAVPLPPLEEQKEIVRLINKLFEKLDINKKVCDRLISDLNLLKQSILSKAFRGELGTNDPSEENAIELLKEVLQEQIK
ncbi:restriction endonuclease subunit S [Bacillus thuringiensis]|nr:restriction endonuclease subunit S [Bacillus thuringiensis]